MNKYLKLDFFWAAGAFCWLCLLLYGAETKAAVAMRPQGGREVLRLMDSPSLRLESLVIEVNGERKRVEPSEGVTVVRGDLITVIDAWLVDKSRSVPIIDVLGFSPRVKRNGQDDRGKVIDTSHDFDPRQSEGGNGTKYAVRAIGSGVLYGEVILSIERPILLSFEIEVNGERRKLLSGDKLVLGPHDGIRVIEILTNVRGNENIKHDLSNIVSPDGRKSKEIRFTRGEAVFARIPIDWQGS